MTKRPNKRQCVPFPPNPEKLLTASHHRVSPRPKRTTRSPRVIYRPDSEPPSPPVQQQTSSRLELRSSRKPKPPSNTKRRRSEDDDDNHFNDHHLVDDQRPSSNPNNDQQSKRSLVQPRHHSRNNTVSPNEHEMDTAVDIYQHHTPEEYRDPKRDSVESEPYADEDGSTTPSPSERRVVTRAFNKTKSGSGDTQLTSNTKTNTIRKPNDIHNSTNIISNTINNATNSPNLNMHTNTNISNTPSPNPGNKSSTNLVCDEIGWSVSQLQRIGEAVKQTGTVNGLLIARELRKLPRGGGAFSGSLACRASKYVTNAVQSIQMVQRYVNEQASDNMGRERQADAEDSDVTTDQLRAFIAMEIFRVNEHARLVESQSSGRAEMLQRVAAEAALAESEVKLGITRLANEYATADGQGIRQQIRWLRSREAKCGEAFGQMRQFLKVNRERFAGIGGVQDLGLNAEEGREDETENRCSNNGDSGFSIMDVDMDMEFGMGADVDEKARDWDRDRNKRKRKLEEAGLCDDAEARTGGTRRDAVEHMKMMIEAAKTRGNRFRRQAEQVRRELNTVMDERDSLMKRIHSAQRVYVENSNDKAPQ